MRSTLATPYPASLSQTALRRLGTMRSGGATPYPASLSQTALRRLGAMRSTVAVE